MKSEVSQSIENKQPDSKISNKLKQMNLDKSSNLKSNSKFLKLQKNKRSARIKLKSINGESVGQINYRNFGSNIYNDYIDENKNST